MVTGIVNASEELHNRRILLEYFLNVVQVQRLPRIIYMFLIKYIVILWLYFHCKNYVLFAILLLISLKKFMSTTDQVCILCPLTNVPHLGLEAK